MIQPTNFGPRTAGKVRRQVVPAHLAPAARESGITTTVLTGRDASPLQPVDGMRAALCNALSQSHTEV